MKVKHRQDYAELRAAAYRDEIGDGAQIDAFAKALAEIIEAVPGLDGPGVREARGIIAQRTAIKSQFSRTIKGS